MYGSSPTDPSPTSHETLSFVDFESESAAPATPTVRPPSLAIFYVAAYVSGIAIGAGLAVIVHGLGWRGPAPSERSRPVTHAAATQASADVVAVAAPAAWRAAAAPTPLLGRTADETFSPSFSRDGRTLYFHAGRAPAALMRAPMDQKGDAAGAVALVSDAAANGHVSPSPDGTWLAYDSDRDGVRAVFIRRVDGGEGRRVSGDGFAAVPNWSPDGLTLAFVKAEPAHQRVWNLWLVNLRDGSLRRLTRHIAGQAWKGSWFPDGRRLAYSVERSLVVVDVDSGATRVYPSPNPRVMVRTPAVSPDGTRIAFQLYRDGIWLPDVGSGRMQRLHADPTAEEFAWAPDGGSVVYHARHAGRWSLWRLPLDPTDS